MDLKNKVLLKEVRNYLYMVVALFIYVSGWVLFLLPKGIMGGSVSGIAALVHYATRAADGTGGIPVAAVYLPVNIILLVIGILVLGKAFGGKTLFATLVITFFFAVLPEIYPQEIITSLSQNDYLLCALMGGGLSGLGIGLCMNTGGSSGGTDIPALILYKYFNIGPGKVVLFIDLLIIACSYFVFHDITHLIYGYVMVGVSGFTIDVVVGSSRQSYQFFVFSKKYDLIADRITKEFGRGVTVINTEGWYTKEKGTVLMIIVKKYESNEIFQLIQEIDPAVFISISNARAVHGQGFDKMKKFK